MQHCSLSLPVPMLWFLSHVLGGIQCDPSHRACGFLHYRKGVVASACSGSLDTKTMRGLVEIKGIVVMQ